MRFVSARAEKIRFESPGFESHVLGQMDWISIRARWLGNHDKLPVHEPEAATVLSSAMAGRIKSKKSSLGHLWLTYGGC